MIKLLTFIQTFDTIKITSLYFQTKLKVKLKMPHICSVCNKNFATKRSCRRHEEQVHNIPTQGRKLNCNECEFQSSSMKGMAQHSNAIHGTREIHDCVYCDVVFIDEDEYREHLRVQHAMPQWDESNNYDLGGHERVSIFNDGLKSIKMHIGEEGRDMLEFLVANQREIKRIIRNETVAGPAKMQFAARIQMVKDSEEEGEVNTEFFVNTRMVLIYPGEEMTDDEFWENVEKMLNTISTFTSEGSGWRFSRLLAFELKFARFSPIRAGSYIALPPKYVSEQNLLNINNINDPNCFLYCYTAAYHLNIGPPLVNEKTTWRKKRSPELYGPKNKNAHQPKGTYQMPMALGEIGIFETENDVQVNVFR